MESLQNFLKVSFSSRRSIAFDLIGPEAFPTVFDVVSAEVSGTTVVWSGVEALRGVGGSCEDNLAGADAIV